MVLTPAGASACTRAGEPTSLIFPFSISTAAGESTFPVWGSSSRPAFTRDTEEGDWAASCPVGNRTKNSDAHSVNRLRMRLGPPPRSNPLIFSITALHGIQQLFGIVSDAIFEHDFDVFD